MKTLDIPSRRLGRPPTGRAVPAAERMRRMRARRKADGLRAVTRWEPAAAGLATATVNSDHRLHDIRSLALHALIVAKIERDRSLLAIARRNLVRWRKRFKGQPERWWLEWITQMKRPWPELAALLASMEADVYPLHAQERADLIDGSIGEGSAFHESFGYYAQGVGPRTATLPSGWRRRLVHIKNDNRRGITGLCLEVNEFAVSKYVAGRAKDLDFTAALAQHHMTTKPTLLTRLTKTRISAALRPIVRARILRDFSRV